MISGSPGHGPATSPAAARTWTSRQRPANARTYKLVPVSLSRGKPRDRPAAFANHPDTARKKEATMSIWLLILMIVLVVMALGGFGYGRR